MENEERNPNNLAATDAPYWLWLNKVKVDGMPFDLEGRKYQQDIMRPYTPDGRFKHNEIIRKGSQTGATIGKTAEAAHGAIHGKYPQGIIFYFPSAKAVELYSASRFKPFIDDNPEAVGTYMGKTDRVDVRKMGGTNIYFFGATATSRVGGSGKKDAMAVRSTPADWILLDERDLFDEEMASQVNQRLGNSKIWRRTDMGTPTIPDYGIDLLYKKSDQRRWQIKCESCYKHTCLETEFPGCIKLDDSGGYFKCSHCGGRINPNNGTWQADYKDRDIVGYWTSQLLNPNCKLPLILRQFSDPESYDMTEGEFQRIVLGRAFIESQDELLESDVYACCGRDGMAYESKVPCAMGVDVGNPHYVVIGYKLDRDRYKIIKVARAPDWDALHDIARKYNVRSDVIDAQPEYHYSREFQRKERHGVYLCYYNETQRPFTVWTPENIVKVLRTEIFDASHHVVKEPGQLTIPRVCEEIKLFAKQLTKSVRVLQTDQRTGTKIYRYICRGDKEDHYRNALNYFLLACQKMGISREVTTERRPVKQDMSYSLGAR